MRLVKLAILLPSLFLSCHCVAAGEEEQPPQPKPPFQHFTGKITRNHVRLRAQPSIDAPIIKELGKDEMVVVIGEEEDFYAVKPPAEIKTYIFRTYVIDDTIEGNHVNVRLEPDTEAPVIGQLNTGDKIQGKISSLNNKWYEITAPEAINFYIAKEFIDKIGNPSMMAAQEKRRNEVNQLLESTYTLSRDEMAKPFNQVNIDSINQNLDTIITSYGEFHEQVGRAKALKTSLHEDYLNKKIAYLEAQKNGSSTISVVEVVAPLQVTAKMQSWNPVEEEIFNEWATANHGGSLTDFYAHEKKEAITLSGVIEPYARPVRNKPGDYILIHKTSKLPIAILYSTIVDLDQLVNRSATLLVTPRQNNNFAFPAYFVLEVE